MQRRIISAIFSLSGAAGLIFEVVWARQLVLVFGNTTQAISAILTGFFGGMAIGNWYGGQAADHFRRPLRLYGLLEIVLACIVVVTPLTFPLIGEAYRVGFASLQNEPLLLSFLRFVLSLIALAPATVLMGATLPTLTRHLAREASSLGREFTGLYVANTMGAVFGAGIAGFVLIELLGLSGALLVGACCSLLAGSIALIMDIGFGNPTPRSVDESGQPVDASTHQQTLAWTFAFISGFTSLSYQTLWTRLIASGTGSSTYVFTTILVIFLIGLAMGAVEYKRVRHRLEDVVGAISITQVALGLSAVAGMLAINKLDHLPNAFVLKALAAVLPATALMGFGFPAASALITGGLGGVGTRAGVLLAANTAGAVAATFLVPFFLIARFGSPPMLAITASINVIAGIAIALGGERRRKSGLRLATFGGAAIFAIILVAGVVSGRVFVDPQVARMQRDHLRLYRSAEDAIASVQAGELDGRKQLWVTGFSMTSLTVDAKLMPILPVMLRPAAQSVLTIAFGMGSSYRSALIAGLQSDAVELVPSVPGMFDFFYSDAKELALTRRGRIIIGDGRNFIELTDRNYDIVVVDPPPPLQSSGVSIISSREFYTAARKRLNPGGVMMQWVPWGQSMPDFKNHLRTFASVFANVLVLSGPGENGFYMLGSESAMTFTPENIRNVLNRPGVLADISSAYDSPKHDVEGWAALIPELVRLSPRDVDEFAGPGHLITDDRPLPEYFLIRELLAPSEWLDAKDVKSPQ